MNNRKRAQRKVYERSANCAITNVTVSFNVRDDFERALLDFADTRIANLSGMVKRILAELRRRDITTPEELFSYSARPNISPEPAVSFPIERSRDRGLELDEDPGIAEEFDPIAAFIGGQ